MTAIRTHKASNFTVLANNLVTDKALSWEARGLMAYLLSRPDGWIVRRDDLINQSPGGRDKVKRVLKELETEGYLIRWKERGEGGLFVWQSEVFENREDCAAWRSEFDHGRFSVHGDHGRLSGSGETVARGTVARDPVHLLKTELVKTEEKEEPEVPSFSGEKDLQNPSRSDLSLSDPERARKKPKPKAAQNPEPNQEPEREREPEVEEEFREFVRSRLEPTCKGEIMGYVNVALSNDRPYWRGEYHRHQETRLRSDSVRRRILEGESPILISESIDETKQARAAAQKSHEPADLVAVRDAILYQWANHPERHAGLMQAIVEQDELSEFPELLRLVREFMGTAEFFAGNQQSNLGRIAL